MQLVVFMLYIGCRACLLLPGVHFMQCSEYWVMCLNVCVIHLQLIFAHLVSVVFSIVFNCFSFLYALIMSVVFAMIPYLCPVFNTWFEYSELLLLFVIV